MALTPVDRELLKRCLQKEPGSWNEFVDRFLGLIYHVIHHTAYLRSMPLRPEDVEDLAAEVLLQLVANNYTALRQFRGESSLATYLTVITRRICVHEMSKTGSREIQAVEGGAANDNVAEPAAAKRRSPQAGLESLEEVAKLLNQLPQKERRIVQLHYLEGRSYEEIATTLNIPLNSIGPILTRARKRLRGPAKPD